MSDLEQTIKFLGWALSKAEEMRTYKFASTSALIQKETLVNHVNSALAASKRLYQG